MVSSGRSLWMRFESDSTIQYSGFRAAYSHILNPKPLMADIGDCNFRLSGDEVTFGHENITADQKDYSRQNNVPIDCVWHITVEEGNKVYLQILNYSLQMPNECNLNQIQVRRGAQPISPARSFQAHGLLL